jgi:hypothetical protein
MDEVVEGGLFRDIDCCVGEAEDPFCDLGRELAFRRIHIYIASYRKEDN